MKENFLTYDLSKKMQSLGFDLDKKERLAIIDQTEYIHIKGIRSLPRGAMCYDEVICPLWQQAFDFIMDKYNLFISANHRSNSVNLNKTYWYCVYRFKEAPYGCEVVIGLIDIGCHKTDYEAKIKTLEVMLRYIKQES